MTFEWQSPQPKPRFSSRLAKKLIGKHILIGYTYLKPDSTVDRQMQHHGVVIKADKLDGVHVLEHGTAKTIVLPPDLRSFTEAPRGTYKLLATGELVQDPHYTADWVVETNSKPAPALHMPSKSSSFYHVYGVGTVLYGQAEKRDGGSYIATKWLILFLLPIYPIASFRIHPRKAGLTLGFGSSSAHASECIPRNWGQIARTVVITYATIGLLALMSRAAGNR